VDLFDRLALANRKYERRRSVMTGKPELLLDEVLRHFHGKTILDLDVRPQGREPSRLSHERGRPISLIDAIAEIGGSNGNWYEVMETPPSGDYMKVRITAQPSGGQLSMLLGRRVPEHSPTEDALLDTLRDRESRA
jgi:hypothetical protein